VIFDPVHDTQAVHRALVRAFSFPGTPVSIEAPASRCAELRVPPALEAVARTLLDPETSYSHPLPYLTELTGARRRSDPDAAFLFLSEWDEGAWAQAFDRGFRGTLADPHRGSTVVAWTPVLLPTTPWTASGPGLERPTGLALPGGAWVEARNRACVEFPLGVDLIWVRGDATLVALPRTTRLVPRKEA
jgi:alpha-D-ribose 1-methylphosphonate 5-triphosphate synthase subunit PhnH